MAAREGNVVPLFGRFRPCVEDWSQNELAQFYRVEAVLHQANMAVEHARGLTDEGEPWFAFYHAETGDVFVHFARIDGVYIVESPALREPLTDVDFMRLVGRLANDHPLLVIDRKGGEATRLYLHPATLLISAVAVLFFKTTLSEAAEAEAQSPANRTAEIMGRGNGGGSHFIMNDLQAVALFSAIAALPLIQGDSAALAEDGGPATRSVAEHPLDLPAHPSERDAEGAVADGADAVAGLLPGSLLTVSAAGAPDQALPVAQHAIDSDAPAPDAPEVKELPLETAEFRWPADRDSVRLMPEASETTGEPARQADAATPESAASPNSAATPANANDAHVFLAAAGVMTIDLALADYGPEVAEDAAHVLAMMDEVDEPPAIVVSPEPEEGEPFVYSAAIDLLSRFVAETPDYEVVYEEDRVILFDLAIANEPEAASSQFHFETIQFADGTSISVIGVDDSFLVGMEVA